MDDFETEHTSRLDRAMEALRQLQIPPGPASETNVQLRRALMAAQSQCPDSEKDRIRGGLPRQDHGCGDDEGGAIIKPSNSESPPPPITIIVGRSTDARARRFAPAIASLTRVGPLSYCVSAVLMCVVVFLASRYKLADDRGIASSNRPSATFSQKADPLLVGNVTGMSDCQWADSPVRKDGTHDVSPPGLKVDSPVASGRTIQLAAGLIEVTYRSGAKILLQGPATFEVDAGGGFLRIGKLTGKQEKSAHKSNLKSTLADGTPLAIRTPSAIITDLGTEFSVSVDSDGRTTSRVFRGAVRVHPIAVADDRLDRVLLENEAAQVESRDEDGVFIRRIGVEEERRSPVELYGTGLRVPSRKGVPHWQAVAISGHPDFQPEGVTRAVPPEGWPGGGANGSHWVSTFGVLPVELSDGAVCTFRTTIHLHDVRPESVVVRGWLLTNGRVGAMRLNGRGVPLPDHSNEVSMLFRKFSLTSGFIAGVNELEIDAIKVQSPRYPLISICVDFATEIRSE